MQLQKLDLSKNELIIIPLEAMKVFEQSKTLKFFDLSENSLTGLNDIFIDEKLAEIESIEHFSMAKNRLESLNMNDLGTLTELDLGQQTITVFTINGSIPTLKTLNLQIKDHSYLVIYHPLCFGSQQLQYVDLSNWELIEECRYYFDRTPINIRKALGSECNHLQVLTISNIKIKKLHQETVYMPKLEILNAAQNNLIAIREIAFIQSQMLLHLDLSYNEIQSINKSDGVLLANLIYLNLQGNKFATTAGLQNINFIQTLNLAQNELTEISKLWFKHVKDQNLQLKKLNLGNNHFNCTCSIQPFQKWILTDTDTFLDPTYLYQCKTPSVVAGISIATVKLDCRSYFTVYLSTGISTSVLDFIVIALSFHYRWHIKYRLFLLFRRLCYHQQGDRGNDHNIQAEEIELNPYHGPIHYRRYDAYVAYHRAEEAWINEELIPNIEEGPEPFQLCIKERGDIPPGCFLLNAIADSIRRSRKAITVLSENFVDDEMCHFQLQMAQMRLLHEGQDVIILILLQEIRDIKLTLLLRKILCKKNYYKWPQDNIGRNLFWRCLREELKKPVRR